MTRYAERGISYIASCHSHSFHCCLLQPIYLSACCCFLQLKRISLENWLLPLFIFHPRTLATCFLFVRKRGLAQTKKKFQRFFKLRFEKSREICDCLIFTIYEFSRMFDLNMFLKINQKTKGDASNFLAINASNTIQEVKSDVCCGGDWWARLC